MALAPTMSWLFLGRIVAGMTTCTLQTIERESGERLARTHE
ncbi:MAG TPA: hypothetical protein VJP85_08165 [Candidatus Baltobacteraceae bacterium]|nr:hypothetical protein [Candidatus Baltobacteraceae bacterium]